jgi:hypothetical protein
MKDCCHKKLLNKCYSQALRSDVGKIFWNVENMRDHFQNVDNTQDHFRNVDNIRDYFQNVDNIFISVCFRYSFKIRKRNPQGFNWGNPPNIFRLSHKADTQRRPNMCGKQVGTSEEEAPLIPQVLSWKKIFKIQILHLKIEIPLKRVFLVRRTFLPSPGSGGIRDWGPGSGGFGHGSPPGPATSPCLHTSGWSRSRRRGTSMTQPPWSHPPCSIRPYSE